MEATSEKRIFIDKVLLLLLLRQIKEHLKEDVKYSKTLTKQ